ncbi:hypothetical protein JXQ70_19325 [bacterium]|nr:hypothetical protein [bacterium]
MNYKYKNRGQAAQERLKHEVTRALVFIETNPPGTAAFADTSSLIYLAKTGLLPQFVDHFQVRIARTVLPELFLDQKVRHPETRFLKEALEKCILEPENEAEANPGFLVDRDKSSTPDALDQGERGVLRYYLKVGAGFILTDDHKVIRTCRTHRYPFTSTILVPCLLYRYKLLIREECSQALTKIFEIGYFNDHIYRIARKVMISLSAS